MRNYRNLESYLNLLNQDIYAQPPDPVHTAQAQDVIDNWCSKLLGCESVLDLGCGQGICSSMFARHGIKWTGVTLGPDFLVCKDLGLNVHREDYNFLPFADNSFDLVFARHSLEHSFSPLFSLFEWRRVCKQWICIITPNPYSFTVRGKNHLSVLYADQMRWLFEVSHLNVIWENQSDFEFRYMLEKTHDFLEKTPNP